MLYHIYHHVMSKITLLIPQLLINHNFDLCNIWIIRAFNIKYTCLVSLFMNEIFRLFVIRKSNNFFFLSNKEYIDI